MQIVNQSVEIVDELNGREIIEKIEMAGRVCYKSEDRIKEGSAEKFVKAIVKSGHNSVIEHVHVTVKFVVNRAIANQIVRHRIASYSQESTRYCNYSKDKFRGEITVVKPSFIKEGTQAYEVWEKSCLASEQAYFDLMNIGLTAEQARGVLPHDLKTELVMTANLREWLHFFDVRVDPTAHEQIIKVAKKLQEEFREKIPVIFV